MAKRSGSSRPARPPKPSGDATKNERETRAHELAALAARPDHAIDTSDIPEITRWSGAEIGRFYRPVKQVVTIRLDAEVVSWFKARAPRYQTAVNEALRDYIRRNSR